ncbi:MAG: hypothetical protein HPY83_09880 [Anaerolineae bacterium]|nr:hypothetical protein [Anaerolineae bacterium]
MTHKSILRFLALGLLVAFLSLTPTAAAEEPSLTAQAPVPVAFTYQGHLLDGGSPANGGYDFEFRLFDASTGGSEWMTSVTVEDVAVSNGVFTSILDFGSNPFTGPLVWLQVGVRPGSSDGSYTILTPRTPLTATPYALGLRFGTTMIGTGSGLTVASSDSGTAILGQSNGGYGVYGASSGSGAAIMAAGNGRIKSSAKSYVFVPGNLAVLHAASVNATLQYWGQGDVSLVSSGAGDKQIVFPVTLPAILYAQPVRVEEVSFTFKPTGAGSTPTRVEVYRAKMDGTYRVIASVEGAYICEPAGSWCPPVTLDITSDNVLAADDGQLAVRIYCNIPSGGRIEFTGVRVRLGHS